MNSNKKSHKQNVDNMEGFTTLVATFEPEYNPSENRLSISNQVRLKEEGEKVIDDVMAAESVNDNAVAARTAAFERLDGQVTRTINGLRISDSPEQTIEQGESIVRELRNKRASEIDTPEENTDGTEKEESDKQNKIHSGSMDTKIENFSKLIIFLSLIPFYKPNEADLTITALREQLSGLKQVNTNCNKTYAALAAARRKRDLVLYTPKTGLVPVALASKLYVKSAYGAISPEYKSIRGISFTKPR